MIGAKHAIRARPCGFLRAASHALDESAILRVAERQRRRHAHRRDTGQRARSIEQSVVDAASVALVEPAEPGIDAGEKEALVRVAGCAPALRNRRPRKDARRREQCERQRHLTDDHEVAHAETPPASSRLAAAILQVGNQVPARQLQRRPEAEGNRAHRGKRERRCEHADVRGCAERHVERQRCRRRRGQGTCRPVAQHQPEGSASAGEQDPLGQELANDACSSCSKRESDGQFLAARRAARQQHVRDIQARNHENDTGQRHHQARQHLHSNVGGRRRAGTARDNGLVAGPASVSAGTRTRVDGTRRRAGL